MSHLKKLNRWIPVLGILLLLACAGVTVACPMCRDSIGNTDAVSPTTVTSGFNTSIYCLLLGFFGALGLVIYQVCKAVRQTPMK